MIYDSADGEKVLPVTNAPSLSLFGVLIPDDSQMIAPRIRSNIIQGWYEKTEAQQFEGFSRPGDRIIEVGSGIGFLSIIMSRDPRRRICRVSIG